MALGGDAAPSPGGSVRVLVTGQSQFISIVVVACALVPVAASAVLAAMAVSAATPMCWARARALGSP